MIANCKMFDKLPGIATLSRIFTYLLKYLNQLCLLVFPEGKIIYIKTLNKF